MLEGDRTRCGTVVRGDLRHQQPDEFAGEQVHPQFLLDHRQVDKGNAQCPSRKVPLPLLDELVLSQLEGQVFTPTRMHTIPTETR